MKRLSAIVILITILFSIQVAFAQTNTEVVSTSEEAPQPAVIQQTTQNTPPTIATTTSNRCIISDKLMEEYSKLIMELKEAESEGNKEKVTEKTNKVIELKHEIAKTQQECMKKVPMSTAEKSLTEKPSVISSGTVDKCSLIEHAESKYAHYKEFYSLSDEELKKKGYQSREEIGRVLKEISDEIIRLKKECGKDVKIPDVGCKSITCHDGSLTKCEKKIIEKCGVNTFSVFNQCEENLFRNVYVACYDGVETNEGSNTCKSSLDWQKFAKDFCNGHCKKVENCICSTCPELPATSSGGGGGGTSTVPLAPPIAVEIGKPIATDSGEEIKNYYKTRIEKITTTANVEDQMRNLKKLREEIDDLIEKLIKSKDAITTNEIGALVTKISVNPGRIMTDNIEIKTTGKKILTNINSKPISIEPTEKEVIIRDSGLEIKASTATLQNNILKVGNSEVKKAASDIVDKLELTPISIELMEEDARAVYKIKEEENRKLIWLVPIKVEKDLTADAGSGEVLEENLPWYEFLTTA